MRNKITNCAVRTNYRKQYVFMYANFGAWAGLEGITYAPEKKSAYAFDHTRMRLDIVAGTYVKYACHSTNDLAHTYFARANVCVANVHVST